MPQWLAAFIPAALLFAASGVLVWRGRQEIEESAEDIKPEQAKETTKRDARFVKNEVSDAVT